MTDFDQKAINTLRMLAVDAIQKANSGHPGLPLGAAPMAYVLWTRFLKHNPRDPKWADRDRFVLSAGHGSMLLYALLYLTGYDVSLDDLKDFRQWGSITPGHPEAGPTPGVETTTGPLGQGFATGVGMAIAERHLAARFNTPDHPLVSHYTYAIVSDGDLMEGVSAEAASLAGHLKLGRLIYLYDDNSISLDGPTSLSFSEDAGKRFEAYGWQVLRVADGNDLGAIEAAIHAARAETERPSLIMVRTVIGYGSPNKAGTSDVHGSPLGADEVALTKQNLGWPVEPPFLVPDDVLAYFRQAVERGKAAQAAWQQTFAAWQKAQPNKAAEWAAMFASALPDGWDADLPVFAAGTSVATRVASGKVLNALAPHLPGLIGGAADLDSSTRTYLNLSEDFRAGHYAGRNLRFGVREHAMGAIVNGLAAHGGLIPYSATFLVFSDYMRPAMRVAALSHFAPVFVFTHDSIGLGEDGPTHQPVEQVMSLRLIPHVEVIRPADANETAAAWRCAIENRDHPTVLALTRQNVPVLDPALGIAEGVARGAYVLSDAPGGAVDVLLIATGSEVHLALAAQKLLTAESIGARVVSMPSWERFERQPQAYRDSVLPPAVTARVSVEAGVTTGWQKWVGAGGAAVGVDRFGASAPYQVLFEQFGLTAAQIAERAKALVERV
ncbi:MAG: transketolase [Anaerolineae bacterium]|nr:transketolase [Anaerolineae bacterium]